MVVFCPLYFEESDLLWCEYVEILVGFPLNGYQERIVMTVKEKGKRRLCYSLGLQRTLILELSFPLLSTIRHKTKKI